MVTKKLFALASVTALTGLMATVAASGCSSTKTEEGGGGTDAATTPDVKTDATKPKPGDDEEEPTSTECKGTTEVDATKLPWKAPFVDKGACTAAELAALVKYVDENDTAKYADWKGSVPAGCKDCIFGKEADAAWKPLLENAKGELVGLNVGGCIAIAANGGNAPTAGSAADKCGQSYQNWFDCRFEACADCPSGDTAALQKCLSAASKAGCKKAFDAVSTVCGDQVISDAETACDGDKFVFEGPIKGQCIGLSTDGGDN
jgi:hypothetical protein